MRLYGDAGVAIATGVLTFVVLVFAEVVPKPLPLYPEKSLIDGFSAGSAAEF